MLTLLANPAMRVAVVVGADGAWYVLVREPGRRQADEAAALAP